MFSVVFLKLWITTQAEVTDLASGGSTHQRGSRFVSISLCPRERNLFPLIWVPGRKCLKSSELPLILYSTECLPFALTCLEASEEFCSEMRNLLFEKLHSVSSRMIDSTKGRWSCLRDSGRLKLTMLRTVCNTQ